MGKSEHLKELVSLFAQLKTSERAQLFLLDILTPHELAQLAERWQIIKRLAQGMPQRKIKEELGISIQRVTRGSKAFQQGGGGFQLFLSKN
jgi:Trp operon repressor